MAGAGLQVESAKGECNFGQHEIAFMYEDALTTCDNHVVYKTAAKEIAAQEGYALTFMAKYNEREGNSCHIHLSFRGLDGSLVMADESDTEHGMSDIGRQFIAGQLAHMQELSLLFAPNINSYKRFSAGSFAPTSIEWGRDNRTCALRLVGRRAGLRLENRVPGGDVNPYLAVAAMIAAGLDGIEKGLELEPAFTGNAYESGGPKVPDLARRGGRPLVGVGVGGGDLRRGRAGALRQHGPHRARRVRPRHHRLGALPRLRAPLAADVDHDYGSQEQVNCTFWP